MIERWDGLKHILIVKKFISHLLNRYSYNRESLQKKRLKNNLQT